MPDSRFGGTSNAVTGGQHHITEGNIVATIRRRRRFLLWLSLAEIPIALLVAAIVRSGIVFGMVIAICLVIELAAIVRLALSECPRCGKLFHYKGFYGNTWTRRCLHCGLSLNA
jgi:hypothetical protein